MKEGRFSILPDITADSAILARPAERLGFFFLLGARSHHFGGELFSALSWQPQSGHRTRLFVAYDLCCEMDGLATTVLA